MLLVVIAFLVAFGVVKSGLGARLSLMVVSVFGGSTLGLGYSIFLTDAVIAPAFPSNTARGGVLFPIVLSLAQNAGSKPDDPSTRRLGGYLMFCGMASLAVSSALWLTATSANPIGVSIAEKFGLQIGFGSWLVAASVPALPRSCCCRWCCTGCFPPGVAASPDAPAAARAALRAMGPLSRDEWIVAVAFALMVTGWVMAGTLNLSLTAVAFGGLAVLLATSVLTVDDISLQGSTLATYLWLAVLFALSSQLNELGFMSYVGDRLTSVLGGISWPIAYVAVLAALRADALHVRQPVVTGAGALRRLPRCRHAGRRAGAAYGVRAPVCQQLLLGDHAAGRQPERHLRRQRLPDPGRAVPARRAHDDLLRPRFSS